MIYLMEYDQRAGRLVRMQAYGPQQRHQAEQTRLDVELRLLKSNLSHEVVLLEAASEGDLRQTHRRYFEGLEQLLRPAVRCAA
jgi:hypothetical protein